MGVFLLMLGTFLIMGGSQVLLVFAAYGFIAALVIGGSMAVGKFFFRL
jgi:hypothetical protein